MWRQRTDPLLVIGARGIVPVIEIHVYLIPISTKVGSLDRIEKIATSSIRGHSVA